MFAIILPIPLFPRTKTDVVVMKNGDHLTGEIKGLNEGALYLDMEYILGTSSVQWSAGTVSNSAKAIYVIEGVNDRRLRSRRRSRGILCDRCYLNCDFWQCLSLNFRSESQTGSFLFTISLP